MKNAIRTVLLLSFLSLNASASAQHKDLKVPFKYALGKSLYDESCSSCHGVFGHGTEKGPPLMHDDYKPSHHDDASFYRAALKGVKQHHWAFGNMQPVPAMSKRKVDKILPYLRWLQRQYGIK